MEKSTQFISKNDVNIGKEREMWYLCGDHSDWSPTKVSSNLKTTKMNHLTFFNDKELLRLRCDRIIFVASDGNYSTIKMADGDERMVTTQLGQIEKLMGEQLGEAGACFIRIGRSLIINKDFIYYINPNRQQLILSDDTMQKHTLSASKDALHAVKEYLERELTGRGSSVNTNK